MAYECLEKSPVVNVGQTFVTKYGNIRLIKVYDNGSGQIGVKPIGWTNEVIITMIDYRDEFVGPIKVTANFFTLVESGAHFWVCGEIEDVSIGLYPEPGIQTILNEDNNYIGYFCKHYPAITQDPVMNFIPAPGWTVVSYEYIGTGQFGCEGGHPVTLIELRSELNPLRISAITTYEVFNPNAVIADVLINGDGTGTLSIVWGDQGTTTHAIDRAGQYYFDKALPAGTHNICGSIGETQECATIIIEDKPVMDELKVSKLELIQDVDSPGALIAKITMIGDGTGTLVIDWGDGTIERFKGYVAGLEDIGIEKPDSILHVCAWIEGSESKECAYYIPTLYLLGIAGIGIIILMGIA